MFMLKYLGQISGQWICTRIVGNQTYATACRSFGMWIVEFRANIRIRIEYAFFLGQVTIAKTLPPNKILPLCDLTLSIDGVLIETTTRSSNTNKKWNYTIDTISYGVQDLVYTRVFAMIVVKENYNIKDPNPFEVHAFVCDSR